VEIKNVGYLYGYGVTITLLLSKIQLIFKEYDVYIFLLIEFLKFKLAMLFIHEYQFIKKHNMSSGKLALFPVVVM